MNSQTKIPFHTLISVVGALFFLFGMIVPVGKKFYHYQIQIKQQELRLKNADAAVSQLPAIVKELIHTEDLLKGAQHKIFFREHHMSEILSLINDNVKNLDINIKSVRPKVAEKSHMYELGSASPFYFLPFYVQVNGSFRDISTFVSKMSKNSQICLIKELKYVKSRENSELIEAEITFHIALTKIEPSALSKPREELIP